MTLQERNTLAVKYRHIPKAVAGWVARKVPVAANELESMGLVALLTELDKWDPLRAKGSLEAYLKIRIALRIRDQLRLNPEYARYHKKLTVVVPLDQKREFGDGWIGDGFPIDPPSQSPSPESLAIDGQRARRLADAVATLPEKWQRILRLRYWHEMTMAAIAREVGVSESRVSQLLQFISGRLAGQLEGIV